LNETLEKHYLGIDLVIKKLKEIISPNYSNNIHGTIYYGSVDYVKRRTCSLIFKYCENTVRQLFGHKRKLNIDGLFYNAEADKLFNEMILPSVMESLELLQASIPLPDASTEIELNAQNTLRWKATFEKLTAGFAGDGHVFFAAIRNLAEQNQQNPSVENIYYEASKFIAGSDRTISLQLYLHYIYADLKSERFDNKQLNKTLQKSLFKSKEEVVAFEGVVNRLIVSKDLEAAILETSALEQTVKRKIIIDKASIASVEARHLGTVALLNEYLADEMEAVEGTSTVASANASVDTEIGEIQIDILSRGSGHVISVYRQDLNLQIKHISTLDYFGRHNFVVDQNEFEIFAKMNGSFKSQLIDNLNETCYELLDDNLINEEDELYIMSADYYQTLLQS
jgi:hypothetical protein